MPWSMPNGRRGPRHASHCGQLYSLCLCLSRCSNTTNTKPYCSPSRSLSLDVAPFTVPLRSLIIIIATLRQIPTRPAGSTGFASQILPRPSSRVQLCSRTVLRACEFVTNEPDKRKTTGRGGGVPFVRRACPFRDKYSAIPIALN